MTARALIGWSLGALALRALIGLLPEPLRLADPLLAVAVVASLPGRPGVAIAAGLLTGFLEDGWSGGWFGQQALSHMVIAFLLSMLAARVDLVQIRPALLVLASAVFADWGIQLLLAVVFDRSVGTPPGVVAWIVTALATAAFGLLVRRFALRDHAVF